MTTSNVIPGALAFVGPPHVSILEGFTYLSVIQVQGSSAVVKKAGPDAGDSEPELEVKVSVLRHRIVEPTESELWPGSYVGQPIAFIQTTGVACDKWAYGLATGYSMEGSLAQLNVHQDGHALHIRLLSTPTVTAVDRLNYALQTGASVNGSILNALEPSHHRVRQKQIRPTRQRDLIDAQHTFRTRPTRTFDSTRHDGDHVCPTPTHRRLRTHGTWEQPGCCL
ncbi:hypothetical protein ON010_g17350 [Phytophthora cinnamomi]|nr:hypothetical protein ON010_g17350 [Phytophthora cinnamomi]